MKYHRHLIADILDAHKLIFLDKKHADKVIEKYMKTNRKWGARDRRFFAECVYHGVRWWRRNWALLDKPESLAPEDLLLHWGIGLIMTGQELPQWVEFEELIGRENKIRRKADFLPLPVKESVPDWMFEWGKVELGDRWEPILHALNEKAPVDLRVNTLRATREQVIEKLKQDEIEALPVGDDGVSMKVRANVFRTEAFKNGMFEVQDRASQLVAPMLQLQPGLRVIDACAGAGGKSLHAAALMKNKGKIIALDIHEWKLQELKQRAARNRVDIIETRFIDSSKVTKRLENTADRLLLDVPCSGMGVLRRNPDTKWKLNYDEVQRLIKLQADILDQYAEMLKVGGIMVYSTCSIMPSENKKQIESFLARSPMKWELIDSKQIDPDQGLGDGFFAQSLKRLI